MERLTVSAERLPDGSTRIHVIDARKVKEHAMEFYWRLKEYEDTGLSPDDVVDLMANHAAAIGKLTETPKWIPVTERLPVPDKQVLAIVSGRWENIMFDRAYELASWSADEGWIMEAWPELEDPAVSHWMPLPDPPKEKT